MAPEVQMVEQGPSGTYGGIFADDAYAAEPRTVGGYVHPDSEKGVPTRPDGGEAPSLAEMKKAELVSEAEALGIEFNSRTTADELRAAIQEAYDDADATNEGEPTGDGTEGE